jgi:predicted O-linked N-acetylglucosamine transferase (SPINDLY family)
LYANYLFTKLSICDWQNLDNELAELSTHIAASLQTARPFSLLGLIDDPALQRQAAENWTQSKDPQNPALGNIGKYPAHSKIRIGYFSADFRNHAVSYLCAELFEKHDRNRFEIIAFSLADPQIKDSMRLRLEAGFDQFIDLHTHSDLQVAQLARKMQIDIAVDLSGHTRGGRPGIFALRAAPLQVSYIGYLGTMGAEYMDYLLADPVIIPKANRKYYTENILYLPSYQVNDTQRQIAEKTFTRQQLGLPEQGFVFCCFNNNYKISPATFRCWMQILNKVTDSVLLIFSECEQVMQHLKAAASQQSIDPQRLVFAERLPLPDYLSRYRQADLFLDTWPYNAGTTGSDALWAGLPLLTCPGAAFPSRIAASLLTAIGLEELIAANQDEYVKLAIEMANQPEKLATIRQKLAVNRLTSPLFDINGFCKHIEAGYTQIYQRYRDGLAATDIWINKQAL